MTQDHSEWTEQRLQGLVSGCIEENLSLDYKAAGELAASSHRSESITKDVSSMANSAGGVIIYGIAEPKDREKRHFPERLDPVARSVCSKETLENIIDSIQPKIIGVVIQPVLIGGGSDHVVYVVEVPKSQTAHQALDKRYYRRHNFKSEPMNDYEVRDVMGRNANPEISLKIALKIRREWSGNGAFDIPSHRKRIHWDWYVLTFAAKNVGGRFAQYVNLIVELPAAILRANLDAVQRAPGMFKDRNEIVKFSNTMRDVTSRNMYGAKYGPSRIDPILPGMSFEPWDIELMLVDELEIEKSEIQVAWTLYADNASAVTGKEWLRDLPLVDLRNDET